MSQIEHSVEQEYAEPQAIRNDTPMENFHIEPRRSSNKQRNFCYYLLFMIPMIVLGLLLTTFFILFMQSGMQSQQDTMSDLIRTFNNKQENDTNEIKDTIRNMSKYITEMKNHSENQQDDFTKNKDAMSDMTKSIKDIQQNIKDLKEIVEANNTNLNKQKDDILQIQDTIRNMSKYITEMRNHSENQQDDFTKNKDAMSNMTKSIKDIQQNIKDLKEIVEANITNLNKQKDDILQIQDTIRNISTSMIETKNNSEKQRDDISKIKGTVNDLSQSLKNVSDLLDRTCKGVLCIQPTKYIHSTEWGTSLQAFQYCQDKKMKLASIESEGEYQALSAFIKSVAQGYYWTSGSRNGENSGFFWKYSGKSLSYTKWWPGYPVSYTSYNCLGIWITGNTEGMYNEPCDYSAHYVCEY